MNKNIIKKIDDLIKDLEKKSGYFNTINKIFLRVYKKDLNAILYDLIFKRYSIKDLEEMSIEDLKNGLNENINPLFDVEPTKISQEEFNKNNYY